MNSNDQIENNQIDQGTVNQTEDVFSSIPCLPGTFAYRIMGGDTCWSIAQRYGISVSELTAANPGIDCYNLPVGGILCIPVRCRPGTFSYMIQRGDTCWSIAQRYSISVSELTAANPGIDCNNLPVGGILCIPVRCRPGTFPYMIQRGDTCWSIAQRYGISVSELIVTNPGIDCNNLPVGGTLCIPRR